MELIESYDHPIMGYRRVEFWEGGELIWVEYIRDPFIATETPGVSSIPIFVTKLLALVY